MGTNFPHITFSATLGTIERIVTYAVGFGVGIGVPLVLAIIFYLVFSTPIPLLLPIPFGLGLYFANLFAPRGYMVTSDSIHILRKIGPKDCISINQITWIIFPATSPPGFTVGIFCIGGIYGTFGQYWNKVWGLFEMYVTDNSNRVELLIDNKVHIIISPDDPNGFISEINNRNKDKDNIIQQ